MNAIEGYCFEDLALGMSASFTKTLSEADVKWFAGVTGDFNPLHVNREYAEQSIFKQPVAHGMLAAGLISAALGCKLPGPGAIYMHQELNFVAPVHFGDTVTATVAVKELIAKHGHVIMTTVCTAGGKEVVIGEARLKVPRREA
ncbi:MAG: MaoC family dehydratase [Desulfobacterales bacterium]|jgi:3-hydroxybutyryl-CoA dehydratase